MERRVRATTGETVDDFPIIKSEDRLTGYVLARYGEPPCSPRARAAEDAYADLLQRCRRRRAELLADVRDRLGRLRPAGGWADLRPWLADDRQVGVLEELEAAVEPPGESAPTPPRKPRRALGELAAAA